MNHLKQLAGYITLLLLLDILICGAGFLLSSFSVPGILPDDIIVLTVCFTIIVIVKFVVFYRGLNRDPGSRTMHTLAAISLKLLMDMILALIWFIVAKKTSLTSVLIFFIIYLTLTLYSTIIILKILKYKSLLN